MYTFLFGLIATWFSALWAPEPNTPPVSKEQTPPNVIFMIGDGMGHSQLSSAFYFSEGEPQITRFPITGMLRTSSSSHKITDSAAGATAYSCGEKTFNGAIGMSKDSVALETILEYLARRNYRTGLIATSSITHATPASYFAHVDSRNKEFEIAAQLLTSPVDFFAGGGKQFFFRRLEEESLFPAFAKNAIVLDTLALNKKVWDASQRYGYLLADKAMAPAHQGRGDFLSEATELALDYFGAMEAPFFLMVEGSQIDWGGHANDGEYLVAEMLDFDRTIGKALDFAERQGNTLVIVTADHECGGFSLVAEEVEVPFRGQRRDYDSLRFAFTSAGHSAAVVPLLAAGPGAQNFCGIHESDRVYHLLKALLP